jgi:membrane protein
MDLASYWPVLKTAALEWVRDKIPQMGAALAFYSVLSIAPLLIIAIAVAGLVFGEQAASGQLDAQIREFVGEEGAGAVKEMLANAQKPGGGILATVVGVVTLLIAATGVFGQLQDSMNTIWEVEPKPGRGIWGLIKDRFLSFSMVFGIGFLLLVSLILSSVLSALGGAFEQVLPVPAALLQGVELLVSFTVITLLFAMIYRFLPDVEIAWGDVWVGSVLTALLFTVGKFAIGLYLGRSSYGSAYGAAGSLVVLLVWIYYSSQILFFGAEFTKAYANQKGSRIRPDEDARPVTAEARARQGFAQKGGARAEAGPRADGRSPRPSPTSPAPRPVVVVRRQAAPARGSSSRSGGVPWGGIAAAAGVAALLYFRFWGEDEDEEELGEE